MNKHLIWVDPNLTSNQGRLIKKKKNQKSVVFFNIESGRHQTRATFIEGMSMQTKIQEICKVRKYRVEL